MYDIIIFLNKIKNKIFTNINNYIMTNDLYKLFQLYNNIVLLQVQLSSIILQELVH